MPWCRIPTFHGAGYDTGCTLGSLSGLWAVWEVHKLLVWSPSGLSVPCVIGVSLRREMISPRANNTMGSQWLQTRLIVSPFIISIIMQRCKNKKNFKSRYFYTSRLPLRISHCKSLCDNLVQQWRPGKMVRRHSNALSIIVAQETERDSSTKNENIHSLSRHHYADGGEVFESTKHLRSFRGKNSVAAKSKFN